jgi:hypothetical protein
LDAYNFEIASSNLTLLVSGIKKIKANIIDGFVKGSNAGIILPTLESRLDTSAQHFSI